MNLQTAKNNVQNILNKLNFIERGAIEQYIAQQTIITIGQAQENLDKLADEKADKIEKLNNETWKKVSRALQIAMKEHHVSVERQGKIYDRMCEIVKHEGTKGLDVEKINSQETGIKVLTKNNFDTLLEMAIESSCKDCTKGHKHCKVYQLLKLYEVPRPTGDKLKCKYAYRRD